MSSSATQDQRRAFVVTITDVAVDQTSMMGVRMPGRPVSLARSAFGALIGLVLVAGCQSRATDDLETGTVSRLEASGASELVTWTCTGEPCPWGNSATGEALVWPAEASPLNARLGYEVSGNI